MWNLHIQRVKTELERIEHFDDQNTKKIEWVKIPEYPRMKVKSGTSFSSSLKTKLKLVWLHIFLIQIFTVTKELNRYSKTFNHIET